MILIIVFHFRYAEVCSMKKRMAITRLLFIIINFIFLFLLLDTARAQDGYFKISGQYRIRPEFRKGYKTLTTDTSKAAFFIPQRARLILDYKKDNIRMFTSVQDIRTWGDEEQLKDNAGLQVNELWLELALKHGLSLKVGRQELVYDDQRLLGNLDWANATRSHDALLVKYINKNKNFNWHLGGAFNQSGEPLFGTGYQLKNYKFLVLTWLKKEFGNNSISVTSIANGLNATILTDRKTYTSYTFGPLYNYQSNKFKGLIGAYYQTGKTDNALLLNAYMINSYAELHRKKAFTGIGIDYISGNSDNTPLNHSHSFSTLYATNHKFYGYMDYFTNLPVDTKQRGLVDPYFRLGLIANKNITTTVDFHYFLLANKNHLSNYKKSVLGNEIDLLIDYKISPVINFQAGYSMMFATKNMELLKTGNSNNYNSWAFIMLKVSPTFFMQELKNK